MQEQQHQIKIYGFLQKAVYVLAVVEFFVLFCQNYPNAILSQLAQNFGKMGVFSPPINAKLSEIVLVILISIGTRAKKNADISIPKSIILPIVFGLGMMFLSLYFIPFAQDKSQPAVYANYFNTYHIVYGTLSLLGILILMVGTDNISKLIQFSMGKDRWNVEEESFDQNKDKVDGEFTINIPYLFYFKGKVHNGWLNMNPFRGTIVIGTPGSGKSF